MECHSTHMADSASEELDRELALSCLSTKQDELYEVEAALQRIANGTYGICEKTGARIPAARLQAIPWTRFSREVQTQREMSSQRRR
jgi:RNA polymerase-binding transcription factor DksA